MNPAVFNKLQAVLTNNDVCCSANPDFTGAKLHEGLCEILRIYTGSDGKFATPEDQLYQAIHELLGLISAHAIVPDHVAGSEMTSDQRIVASALRAMLNYQNYK